MTDRKEEEKEHAAEFLLSPDIISLIERTQKDLRDRSRQLSDQLDKHLLYINAAGIGFVFTLLTTLRLPTANWLLVGALAFFSLSMIVNLLTFPILHHAIALEQKFYAHHHLKADLFALQPNETPETYTKRLEEAFKKSGAPCWHAWTSGLNNISIALLLLGVVSLFVFFCANFSTALPTAK